MQLIKWDKLSHEIEQAKDIDELKKLSDKLEAIRILAKQSKQSLETQNKIATYRIRVERKKGEWLKDNLRKPEEGRPNKEVSTDLILLRKTGITLNESSDAQRIADIPEKKFESLMQEIKDDGEELTKTFMVNTSKKIERELDIQKQKEDIETGKVKLPKGKFEVIVIDPPWNYESKNKTSYNSEGRRVASPYPEMTTEQIKEHFIKNNLPSDDCVLWLWTTHKFIWDAKMLLDVWGFEYKAILVWNKDQMGIGSWLRMQCEFCLLGIKGKPIWENKTYRDIITESRRQHSRKPNNFYKMVREICTGRKLNYFSREQIDGFENLGNEVNKFE